MTLGFAIGMAKIAGAIGAILIFGAPNDPEEEVSLAKDFSIGFGDRRLLLYCQQLPKDQEEDFKLRHCAERGLL